MASAIGLKSGRLRIGVITPIGTVFHWRAFRGSKDSGISETYESAKKNTLNSAGVSERQYEISETPLK